MSNNYDDNIKDPKIEIQHLMQLVGATHHLQEGPRSHLDQEHWNCYVLPYIEKMNELLSKNQNVILQFTMPGLLVYRDGILPTKLLSNIHNLTIPGTEESFDKFVLSHKVMVFHHHLRSFLKFCYVMVHMGPVYEIITDSKCADT